MNKDDFCLVLCILFGHQSCIQQWITLNIPHTEFSTVLCDDSIIRNRILMKLMVDLTSQSLTPINYNSCSALLTLKIGYFTFQTFWHLNLLFKLLKTDNFNLLSLASLNYILGLHFYFNLSSSNFLCCILPLPFLPLTLSIEFACIEGASFKCKGLSFYMKEKSALVVYLPLTSCFNSDAQNIHFRLNSQRKLTTVIFACFVLNDTSLDIRSFGFVLVEIFVCFREISR